MDNVSLSFSQEEVVLILKLLGADTIPGVGQESFGDVSKEVEQHLLASAERTLRARAMISLDDERINMDQVVVALIGTCAVPEYSWLVTRTTKQKMPENRFYHITPSMFVEHTISGPGIHTFTALARQAQMVERLTGFWQLQGQQAAQESRIVSTEEMQRLIEQLMLTEVADADSTQTPAHGLLPEPIVAVNTIALIDHTEQNGQASKAAANSALQPSPELAGVTSTSFVQSQEALWQTMRLDGGKIELRPIMPAAVGEQINAWQTVRLEARKN